MLLNNCDRILIFGTFVDVLVFLEGRGEHAQEPEDAVAAVRPAAGTRGVPRLVVAHLSSTVTSH